MILAAAVIACALSFLLGIRAGRYVYRDHLGTVLEAMNPKERAAVLDALERAAEKVGE